MFLFCSKWNNAVCDIIQCSIFLFMKVLFEIYRLVKRNTSIQTPYLRVFYDCHKHMRSIKVDELNLT